MLEIKSDQPIQFSIQVRKLKFRFPFKIAHGTRAYTDTVILKLQHEKFVGFGEATLPPYLPDNIESVLRFLSMPVVRSSANMLDPVRVFHSLNEIIPDNFPAKAALDMALWQLCGAMQQKKLIELLNISIEKMVPHTYTIGVGSFEEMKKKMEFGLSAGYGFFKLKMDGINDENILQDYLKLSTVPFAVDANQSWKKLPDALSFGMRLQEKGCLLIEQPFHKSDLEWTKMLRAQLNIPIIADEACQVLTDIEKVSEAFSGINIKLQKCGGITPALQMIARAREKKMQILIGCMSESSIGCAAAEMLAPMCDWADLDGPHLNENDSEIVSLMNNIEW